jgi:hypothetical protein
MLASPEGQEVNSAVWAAVWPYQPGTLVGGGAAQAARVQGSRQGLLSNMRQHRFNYSYTHTWAAAKNVSHSPAINERLIKDRLPS